MQYRKVSAQHFGKLSGIVLDKIIAHGKALPRSSPRKNQLKLKRSTTSHIDPVKHFAYLSSSKTDDELLTSIFRSATVLKRKGVFTFHLADGFLIRASAKARKISAKLPKSFSSLLRNHSSVSLIKNENVLLELADTAMFDLESLKENRSPVLGFANKPTDLIFPLAENQDCWVYDLKEKNASKEPVLYLLAHDTLSPSKPQEYKIGSLFLARCAHFLGCAPSHSTPAANDFVEIFARQSALFEDTRCMKLDDGRVILLGNKWICWLRFNNRKFVKGKVYKSPLGVINAEYRISCQADEKNLALQVDQHGIFLFDIQDGGFKYLSTLVDNIYGGTSILINDQLIYYQDGFDENPSAFFVKELYKSSAVSVLKQRDRLRINSVIQHHGKLIFAGQDNILVYTFEAKTKKLKKVCTLNADYVDPVIEKIQGNNHFIIYDQSGSANAALNLYSLAGKPKFLKSIFPNSSTTGWCWIKKQLFVLIRDTANESHSIIQLALRNGELKIQKTIKCVLRTESRWVWVTSFHVKDDKAVPSQWRRYDMGSFFGMTTKENLLQQYLNLLRSLGQLIFGWR